MKQIRVLLRESDTEKLWLAEVKGIKIPILEVASSEETVLSLIKDTLEKRLKLKRKTYKLIVQKRTVYIWKRKRKG